jgi:SAM-dependent methyltransferase
MSANAQAGSHDQTPERGDPKKVSTVPAGARRATWDHHWLSLGNGPSRSFFELGSSVVRRVIFQRAVRFFLEKYFADHGVFFEMGCGTGESSATVPRRRRRFVGMDFSRVALARAQMTGCFDAYLCADIFRLPLRPASVDGIWNLGVMEHFPRSALIESLSEFRRVLKPGGMIVLFWPAEANSSRWLLGPVEWLYSTVKAKSFHFFPDEVSRLKSRRQAFEILREAGFVPVEVDFSMRTALIHMVVIGRNPT